MNNWTPYGSIGGMQSWISTDLAEPRYAVTSGRVTATGIVFSDPSVTTRQGETTEYRAWEVYLTSP